MLHSDEGIITLFEKKSTPNKGPDRLIKGLYVIRRYFSQVLVLHSRKENDITGFGAGWVYVADDSYVDSLIEEMIKNNIPAIVSQWGDPVDLYNPDNIDTLVIPDITKKITYSKVDSDPDSISEGHYFTITSIITDRIKLERGEKDSIMYEISTWGRKQYISKVDLDNCRRVRDMKEIIDIPIDPLVTILCCPSDPFANVLWIYEK